MHSCGDTSSHAKGWRTIGCDRVILCPQSETRQPPLTWSGRASLTSLPLQNPTMHSHDALASAGVHIVVPGFRHHTGKLKVGLGILLLQFSFLLPFRLLTGGRNRESNLLLLLLTMIAEIPSPYAEIGHKNDHGDGILRTRTIEQVRIASPGS
jgi:hypothetical protein